MTDAQDLTQDFFLSVLEGNLLQSADPERGRFRSLLLKALQRATDEAGLSCASGDDTEAPSQQFSRAWAKAQCYWLEIALIGLLGVAGWALFQMN